jgi:hypothetical protein
MISLLSKLFIKLLMKPQQRLMKIVEIEKDYQQHRKRLLSIQHINARKKPNVTTLKPT